MDKILRNFLIAGIVIVCLVLTYYFLIFVPKQAEQRRKDELKAQEDKASQDKKDQEEKTAVEFEKQRIERIKSECTTTLTNYPFENYQKDVARDPRNADYYKKLYDHTYQQCLITHKAST